MTDAGHRRHGLAIVARLLRHDPANYWQVWLGAAAYGAIWFVPWSARGELLVGLVLGGINTLGFGAFWSYRLGRRRDANAVAEWTSTRRLPPPDL